MEDEFRRRKKKVCNRHSGIQMIWKERREREIPCGTMIMRQVFKLHHPLIGILITSDQEDGFL